MRTPNSLFLNTLKIGWKNKIFWFFGLGAIFLTTGNEFLFSKSIKEELAANSIQNFFLQTLPDIHSFLNQPSFWIYFVLLLIILTISFWISLNCQGAIIKKSDQIFFEKPLNKNLLLPKKIFWKNLLIIICSKIILIAISLFIWILPQLLKSLPAFINTLIYFISLIILIISFVFVLIMERYIVIDQVLNQSSLKNSLHQAWNLITKNIFINLESSLIVAATILGLSLVLLASQYLIVLVPWLILLVFNLLKIPAGVFIIAGTIYTLFILLVLAFNSWLSSFYHIYWTLIFKNLTDQNSNFHSQILRIIHNQ